MNDTNFESQSITVTKLLVNHNVGSRLMGKYDSLRNHVLPRTHEPEQNDVLDIVHKIETDPEIHGTISLQS